MSVKIVWGLCFAAVAIRIQPEQQHMYVFKRAHLHLASKCADLKPSCAFVVSTYSVVLCRE